MAAELGGTPGDAPFALDTSTELIGLAREATRQLNICNACRYCEGLCAVFPALERRTLLATADISQLANLCHDCRACYDACMYTPPHDFGINIPKVLATARLEDYQRFVWPASPAQLLRGRGGVATGAVVGVLLLLVIAVAHAGFDGLVRVRDGASSPYELIPYSALLVLMLIPAVFAAVVMIAAGCRFWRATGSSRQPLTLTVVLRAAWDAATLRNLRGGGGDCYYPEEDKPSPRRRHMHGVSAYGFGLCLVSTVAAGIMQDLMGIPPPYPLLSVPVIAGIAGGAGLTVGCADLLLLKVRSARMMNVAGMTVKDYSLLSALAFLGFSGLCVLLTRNTPAFGIVLLIHLAAVMLAFVSAPYSKFAHLIYRFLALVRDHIERESELSTGN